MKVFTKNILKNQASKFTQCYYQLFIPNCLLFRNGEIPKTLHDFCWYHVRLLLFLTILFVIVDHLEATTCEPLPTPFCVQYSLMNAHHCLSLNAHRIALNAHRSSLANVHAA
jgi:hypothetical protein